MVTVDTLHFIRNGICACMHQNALEILCAICGIDYHFILLATLLYIFQIKIASGSYLELKPNLDSLEDFVIHHTSIRTFDSLCILKPTSFRILLSSSHPSAILSRSRRKRQQLSIPVFRIKSWHIIPLEYLATISVSLLAWCIFVFIFGRGKYQCRW